MIYATSAAIALAGVVSAVLLGVEGLATRSEDGLPWLVPSAGAAGLMLVAEAFHRRGKAPGAAAALQREFAKAYGLGAACAGLVPLRGKLDLEASPAAELGHGLAVLVLVLYALRALWLSLRLAWRVRSRATSAAAAAAGLAIGSVFASIIAGPPSPAWAPAVAGIVYGLNVVAPVALLLLLKPKKGNGP